MRYQQGLAVAEVQGADRRLQFDPVNPLAWTSPRRSERRKLARSRVRIRVGSEGREPVWLELPVVLHRPLPEDGTVRSASVICEKVGSRERWRLLVTVARPERTSARGSGRGGGPGMAIAAGGAARRLLGGRAGRPRPVAAGARGVVAVLQTERLEVDPGSAPARRAGRIGSLVEDERTSGWNRSEPRERMAQAMAAAAPVSRVEGLPRPG